MITEKANKYPLALSLKAVVDVKFDKMQAQTLDE